MFKSGKYFFSSAGLLFMTALMLSCSDPLSDDLKKSLVRTLVEEPVIPGVYSLFWDGKNDEGNFVDSGKYECVFNTRNYVQSIQMTAMNGGTGKIENTNDSTVVDYQTIPATYYLYRNSPEPFKLKDGTNIIFDIPETATLLLTIHLAD